MSNLELNFLTNVQVGQNICSQQKGSDNLKYYAVRKGNLPGIYTEWEEVKPLVTGFPGAEYKSFKTHKEAEIYLYGENQLINAANDEHLKAKDIPKQNTAKASAGKIKKLTAYTDGSYNENNDTAGYGAVITDEKGTMIIETLSGSLSTESRQIEGELFAVLTAITFAIKKGASSIFVNYDYEGVEKWATGAWSAEKNCSKEYKNAIKKLSGLIDIKFKKVKAHSGNVFNEQADELAKIGCQLY